MCRKYDYRIEHNETLLGLNSTGPWHTLVALELTRRVVRERALQPCERKTPSCLL